MGVPTHSPTVPDFRRQGAIILSIFALIWAMTGASGIGSGAVYWGIGVMAFVVTMGTIALAVRSDSTRTDPRSLAPDWQRRYNVLGIIEAVAIVGAIIALVGAGVPGLIPPIICIIVGIHFFPLDTTFDQPQYRWTAVLLCAVGAIGVAMFAPAPDGIVRAMVGLAAAVVLWGTATIVARTG